MSAAIYVEDSKNKKISGRRRADATYVPVKQTCPKSCKLMGNGCYAVLSYVGIVNSRLTKKADNLSAVKVAKLEAQAIDNAYGGGPIPKYRDLRIHVSGDSRTIKGTKIINAALGRWKKRGGDSVFGYTHAWKHVPRNTWSNASVLASVDSIKDVIDARNAGYAPAIVVPDFTTSRAFKLSGSDTTWIPCPAETKDKNIACADCRLCMKADWLFSTNRGIAFAAHGVQKEKIKKRLNVIK